MLALSNIYDPLVIRIAAVLAIILSFSPKFEAVINTIDVYKRQPSTLPCRT